MDGSQMEANWMKYIGITESERWKMRLMRLFLVFCMSSAAACADVSDDSRAFDGDQTADSVGVVTSALESCTLLNRRFSALEGTVDTLSCGGSTCTRSCSSSDPSRCSTRCVPANFSVPSVFVDQSLLNPNCRMDPRSRVNVGFPGISQTLCEARGGCWDSRTSQPFYPWCFERLGTVPTCGNQTPGERINAGFPGITAQQCVIGNNACWDDRISGVNWCFFPTSITN